MVTTKEAEKLLEWARKNGARIEISFKETSHKLRIDSMYRAVDPSGNVVPWTRAFGTKSPADVLSSFTVKRVVVSLRGVEEEYGSLSELLRLVMT